MKTCVTMTTVGQSKPSKRLAGSSLATTLRNVQKIGSPKSTIGKIDQYIFEPGPGLQKSGLNNYFGNQFGLIKIHAHSQLFTSATLFTNPLGKTFEVEAILPLNKKKLLPYLDGNKANVIVRNFPMKAPAIKQKLGIKEGGDRYLIATTGFDEKPVILVCKRINSALV